MSLCSENPEEAAANSGWFVSTHWTLVMQAGQGNSPQAEAALARLCETYWYPLYLYLRRMGHTAEDAQDLTQAFFARLLDKNYLSVVEPEKGKFRSFLLMAFKRFLANEWDRANRQKRGSGREILSLNQENNESRYLAEPAHQLTPEKAYERQWALTLLETVLKRVETEMVSAGKAREFEELKIFLTGEKSESSYAELCQKIGSSEGNLKVMVHRLRQRYREILEMEIANTVATRSEVHAEIRHLFAVLAD